MSSDRLRVAVVGTGRMGRLHARVYSQMPQVELVGVYDVSPESAAEAAEQYGTTAFASLDELLAKVKASTIAVPTNFHLPIARKCFDHHIHCLIEKPLARNAIEGREIAARAKAENLIVQVGHIERFNPAVRAMARLDIRPRFIEVNRISPLTFRSIDVGVVLDMMIHDIDIVLWLAGSKVAKVDATGVSVIGAGASGEPVEDVCNARLTFENGCVANLTASRLALKTERRLRIFSPDAYVSLDYQKKYGIVARRSGNLSAIRDAVAKIRAGEIEDLSQLNYADLVHIEELKIDDTEPLRAELDAFVDSVNSGKAPVVSADDGLAAVETAESIIAAIPAQSFL